MDNVSVRRHPAVPQPWLLILTLILRTLCYNIKVHTGRQDNLITAKAVTLEFWVVFSPWLILNLFPWGFLIPVLCGAYPHRSFILIPPEYSLCILSDLCSSSCPSSFASIFSLCVLPALLCPFIHDERVVKSGALWPFSAGHISGISWACLLQEKTTVSKNFESIHFSLALCLPLSSFHLLLSAPSSPPIKNTYGLRFPQLLSC